MEFRFNAGNNRVRIEAGGGNIQGDVALTTGQWTHVAVTVEANSTYTSDTGINFYFDGVVSNRANSDPDPIHPTRGNDLIMGQRYNQSGERWFIGALDDVRVYDKVLTAEEVGRAMLGDPRLAPAPALGAPLEGILGTFWVDYRPFSADLGRNRALIRPPRPKNDADRDDQIDSVVNMLC